MSFSSPVIGDRKGRWRSKHAKLALIESFRDEYVQPEFVNSVTIHPGSHSGKDPVLTVHTANVDAAVKAFAGDFEVDFFWEDYPDADIIAVVILETDTAEEIRALVFSEILESM